MRHDMRLLAFFLLLLAPQYIWAGEFDKEITLLDAIINKDVEEIKQLLNAGADPSAIISLGTSSLHYAAMDGISPDIFLQLVEKSNNNINQKNCTHMTPTRTISALT